MTIFKTFLKILNKNKFIIILYTAILILFGGINLQTQENSMSFNAVKPDIVIINEDKEIGITKDLIDYLKEKTNVKEINKEDIDDALFYREVNYVIYIPKNYNIDYKKNPEIKIKSTNDYQASYAEMILKRYIQTLQAYSNIEENIIEKIHETLEKETTVEITSKLETDKLEQAAFYYDFESYSILACVIYIICMVLSVFNEEKIRKKNIISSTKYKTINRKLLLSNCIYSLTVWLFYLIMSIILIGNIMLTGHGIILMINSLIFTICATTLAFLIGVILTKKEAISGIVNVIALGSSFLCGAFVPVEYLPASVLKIAHIFPTYWYIQTNEITKTLETININTLNPIIKNWVALIIFTTIFIILTNIISKRKQKLGR